MNKLRLRRGQLKGTATRLENFLAEVSPTTSLHEIRARLERLETTYEQFISLDMEMALSEEACPDREKELQEFEETHFRVKSRYRELLDARAPLSNNDPVNSTTIQSDALQKLIDSQSAFLDKMSTMQQLAVRPPTVTPSDNRDSSSSINGSVQSVADVRLPKLSIPPFEGKYSDFKSFIDLFDSCVHNNVNLSSAQKLQYLKGLLKGDPAILIRHLAVTEENYVEARAKLKERYDKPSLVVNSLILTFLNIPKAECNRANSLRNVSNIADEVIRGLRAQGAEAEKRDPWLIHLLLQKVDLDTYQAWAEKCGKTLFPTIDQFMKFINERCDALETVPRNKPLDRMPAVKHKITRAYTASFSKSCPACSQSHHLAYCPVFVQMTIPKRINFVKEKRLCFNCLKPGHATQACQSKYTCQSCKGKHHSSIHLSKDQHEETISSTPSASSQAVCNLSNPGVMTRNDPSNVKQSSDNNVNPYLSFTAPTTSSPTLHVLLPTAQVLVKDNMGNFQKCSVLLDSGSQNTLITESLVQRLGLPRKAGKIYIQGVGDLKAGASKGIVHLEVVGIHSTELIAIQGYVFKKLTSQLPNTPVSISYWDEIKHLPLADPHFDTPKHIDILVGSDYFFTLLRNGQIKKNDYVIAQNTALGWVLCGRSTFSTHNDYSTCNLTNQIVFNEDLNQTLRNFWEIENIPTVKLPLTSEEQRAEDIYTSTTIRIDNKRYSVRLPFKTAVPDLGTSYAAALRRLHSMERKFKDNVALKQAYVEFMRDYLTSGHMELVPEDKLNMANVLYLPHHAVIKGDSLTTKLRVVFDGSSKTNNGKSLNDNQLKGPILQTDINSVILRFRCTKYCFAADIKQMFRMIEVQECDRDYQRILWRESTDQEIQQYRLTTVTYGTSAAPYLSIRTLHQLSEDEKINFPLAAEIIKNNFYVDDCMAGSNTIFDTQKLVSQINNLLMAGGFQLRKWTSNDNRILRDIPEANKIDTPML